MSERPRTALLLYLGSVIATATLLEVLVLTRSGSLRPTDMAAFALFAALALVAEFRPLRWLGPTGKGEVTASWTFFLSLFFVAPFPTASVATGLVMVVVDVASRRSPSRTLFNACQVALSLMAGVLCLRFVGYEPQLLGSFQRVSLAWVLGSVGAGLIAFVLNSLFTCIAIALSQRISIAQVLTTSAGVNMSMDLMLIGLAPAFGVVAHANMSLCLLLAVTVWAIYRTADLALSHRHEATHDLLTSLSNRRSFYEQSIAAISHAAKRNQSLVVLQIDLNGFKGINDRLGHAVGDLVLQTVSDRLLLDRNEGDVVARLGGDEFALLLHAPCSSEDGRLAAERILANLREPLILDGVPLAIDASIGVAEYPTNGEDLDTLLNNADAAMYRAKRGRGGVQLCADSQLRGGPSRMSLVSEVTRGLEQNEFTLLYQPKLDLKSHRYVGVEALVRWNHPTRGLVLPDSFIPTTEQTELIHPLTEYVLRMALTQCAQWNKQGLYVTMSVNVSARNLHGRNFVRRVTELLDATGVAATWLELEITENTVMIDPDRTASVLRQLRRTGVQIAIDDFGTGFSSLANLRTLPIDRVKIDKSFVSDMLDNIRDESIVRSIIDLAGNLGLGTVAEGVESTAVLDQLRRLGCESVQGYLTGRPMPADDIFHLCADASIFAVLGRDS